MNKQTTLLTYIIIYIYNYCFSNSLKEKHTNIKYLKCKLFAFNIKKEDNNKKNKVRDNKKEKI